MRRIKIPQQEFALKCRGGLMCEGGSILWDTMALHQQPYKYVQCLLFHVRKKKIDY